MALLGPSNAVKFEKKHIGRLVAFYDCDLKVWVLGTVCTETGILWHDESELRDYKNVLSRECRRIWLANGRKMEKRANSSVG